MWLCQSILLMMLNYAKLFVVCGHYCTSWWVFWICKICKVRNGLALHYKVWAKKPRFLAFSSQGRRTTEDLQAAHSLELTAVLLSFALFHEWQRHSAWALKMVKKSAKNNREGKIEKKIREITHQNYSSCMIFKHLKKG